MTTTQDQLEQALVRAREEPPPQRSHGEILFDVITGEPHLWRGLLSKEQRQNLEDRADTFLREIHLESKRWHLRNSRFERFHLATGRWYARLVRLLLSRWIGPPERDTT